MSFVHEDDVRAAYEAAEMMLTSLVEKDHLLVPDMRVQKNTIRLAARDIADAVIRSQLVEGDIADVPGVHVERVN